MGRESLVANVFSIIMRWKRSGRRQLPLRQNERHALDKASRKDSVQTNGAFLGVCLKERGGGTRRAESRRRAEGGHPGAFAYSLASPDLNNEAVWTSLRPMAETYVRATTNVSGYSSLGEKKTPEIPLHCDCLQPGSSFMWLPYLLRHP